MMTARTDRTQLFIPGAYPVSRTSYSGAHSAAPAPLADFCSNEVDHAYQAHNRWDNMNSYYNSAGA
eukprot:10168293-Karenia_brevis.AAC.1